MSKFVELKAFSEDDKEYVDVVINVKMINNVIPQKQNRTKIVFEANHCLIVDYEYQDIVNMLNKLEEVYSIDSL